MTQKEALDAAAPRVRALEYCQKRGKAIYKLLAEKLRTELDLLSARVEELKQRITPDNRALQPS